MLSALLSGILWIISPRPRARQYLLHGFEAETSVAKTGPPDDGQGDDQKEDASRAVLGSSSTPRMSKSLPARAGLRLGMSRRSSLASLFETPAVWVPAELPLSFMEGGIGKRFVLGPAGPLSPSCGIHYTKENLIYGMNPSGFWYEPTRISNEENTSMEVPKPGNASVGVSPLAADKGEALHIQTEDNALPIASSCLDSQVEDNALHISSSCLDSQVKDSALRFASSCLDSQAEDNALPSTSCPDNTQAEDTSQPSTSCPATHAEDTSQPSTTCPDTQAEDTSQPSTSEHAAVIDTPSLTEEEEEAVFNQPRLSDWADACENAAEDEWAAGCTDSENDDPCHQVDDSCGLDHESRDSYDPADFDEVASLSDWSRDPEDGLSACSSQHGDTQTDSSDEGTEPSGVTHIGSLTVREPTCTAAFTDAASDESTAAAAADEGTMINEASSADGSTDAVFKDDKLSFTFSASSSDEEGEKDSPWFWRAPARREMQALALEVMEARPKTPSPCGKAAQQGFEPVTGGHSASAHATVLEAAVPHAQFWGYYHEKYTQTGYEWVPPMPNPEACQSPHHPGNSDISMDASGQWYNHQQASGQSGTFMESPGHWCHQGQTYGESYRYAENPGQWGCFQQAPGASCTYSQQVYDQSPGQSESWAHYPGQWGYHVQATGQSWSNSQEVPGQWCSYQQPDGQWCCYFQPAQSHSSSYEQAHEQSCLHQQPFGEPSQQAVGPSHLYQQAQAQSSMYQHDASAQAYSYQQTPGQAYPYQQAHGQSCSYQQPFEEPSQQAAGLSDLYQEAQDQSYMYQQDASAQAYSYQQTPGQAYPYKQAHERSCSDQQPFGEPSQQSAGPSHLYQEAQEQLYMYQHDASAQAYSYQQTPGQAYPYQQVGSADGSYEQSWGENAVAYRQDGSGEGSFEGSCEESDVGYQPDGSEGSYEQCWEEGGAACQHRGLEEGSCEQSCGKSDVAYQQDD